MTDAGDTLIHAVIYLMMALIVYNEAVTVALYMLLLLTVFNVFLAIKLRNQ